MRRSRVRSLARRIRPPSPSGSSCRLVTGCTVQTVTPGAARDGATEVRVWVNDDLMVAACIGPAPAEGSQVAVLLQDGSPLILGKPTGFPVL